MSRETKQITREEARYLFLKHLSGLVDYWADETRFPTCKERLEGLLHSVLVTLDGGAGGLPGYVIVPMQAQPDVEYSKEQGIDHYPVFSEADLPEHTYDIGGALHEELFNYRRGEVERPENLHDFGKHLAEMARRHPLAE